MRAFFLALLTGCATSPTEPPLWGAGDVHAAPPGALDLTVENMAPGHTALLQISGAEPGERVFAVASAAGPGVGPCPDAMAGGCLDLDGSPMLIANAVAGPDGTATLTRRIPASLSPDDLVGVQAVALRAPEEAATSSAIEQPLTLPELPRLAGQWTDAFDGVHTVTRRSWSSYGSEFEIVEATEGPDGGTHIARNSSDNVYFPGMWSRFDWTVDAERQVWYCQQAYAEASYDDAVAVPRADDADPATGGCGLPPFTFSWSLLTPAPFALAGDYVDEWGTSHTIDSTRWSTDWGLWHVTEVRAIDGWLIAQNDESDAYFPGLWSRFDWTIQPDGTYYCQTTFDSISEAEAASVEPPDDSDPAAGGCGGFAWTNLTP